MTHCAICRLELVPSDVRGWEDLPLVLCEDCAGRIDRVSPVCLQPGMNVVALQADSVWVILKGRVQSCRPVVTGYMLTLNYGSHPLRADQPIAIVR